MQRCRFRGEYLLETFLLALLGVGLSLIHYGSLTTLAVLSLLLKDILSVQKPPSSSMLISKRLLQSLVGLGLAFAFGDSWGILGSGFVSMALAGYLAINGATWLDKKLDKLDTWLSI